jgi:hypothetical protein
MDTSSAGRVDEARLNLDHRLVRRRDEHGALNAPKRVGERVRTGHVTFHDLDVG